MEQASSNQKESQSEGFSSKEDYYDEEKKIPKLLNNRFEIKEELGKGAHGKIFLGRDKHAKQ
jgi:hypothetical protein